MSEPATTPQIGYITGLSRQLRELLDAGPQNGATDDVRQQLDQVRAATISKKDASRLIDTLIRAVEALGGDASPRKPDNVVGIDDPYAKRMRERRERHRKVVHAYELSQVEQFGGSRYREAPDGAGRHIKVWKKRVNSMSFRYSDDPEIHYGWAWECTHPDHEGRGSGKVGGGSQLGFATTLHNAMVHYEKYHGEEKA